MYADMWFPGQVQRYYEYEGVEKIGKFIKDIDSPIKEITAVILVLFIVIGLVLVTLKIIETEENKNEKTKSGLQNIFLSISVILNLLSIYILKLALLFYNNFSKKITSDKEIMEIVIEKFTPFVYMVYGMLLIISFMISVGKKNKKILYLMTIPLIIVIFIICAFLILNSNIGYYYKTLL